MISLLKDRGITDSLLLRSMLTVKRHLFVPEPFTSRAYEDSALPIGMQQTISQPYTVAFMTQALGVKAGDKVLEIGTGSGYQAAVLAEMGARVFTIERHAELLSGARRLFDRLNYRIASKAGDGTVGWNEFAPFNGIIVTAGAPDVPEPLMKQLDNGGKLVIPVGDLDFQTLMVVTRLGEKFERKEIHGFKFVPLIGKMGWSR
ncbi:MAG: protein-L-isoaspartate(D-aspartate) O-methyltransferase [Bacteroidetes bacterium]|nr:protein-L-isoaspartate(D-aspartate) O-methyltransferase [Bacteroidota bacterium]MCW5897269.1 protein-L-isoaspartate(D-aspartate) O-methyltransferase [Bacteroidota bacterium]